LDFCLNQPRVLASFQLAAGIHAWMAGAAGTMNAWRPGMMERAPHIWASSRPATYRVCHDTTFYAAIIVAALSRVCGDRTAAP